ncbi:MAG: VapC toxin family PIN domain ribonuclease [Acidobacteria bacterium]|nr:MAG: VapC toxin family PIN domain ribonuclease [Acidobacteriota bacterium]
MAIPSITLYELEVGIAKSNNPQKRKQQLNSFLSYIEVFPFTSKEAKVSTSIRAQLENLGTPMGAYDTLIAGIALSSNSTLVTHNTKEFQRVQNLTIKDWF